jgi:glycosyltransferase involved in cell wall biosynthesis
MLKISIIIPCYNQGQYLDETLQSVLEQRILIGNVLNDGSPDETEIVSQKWLQKILGLTIYIKKWWFK